MVKRTHEGREAPWLPGPPPYRVAIQLKQGPFVGRPIREDDRTVKQAFYKSIGGAHITWGQLEECCEFECF